MNRGSRVSGRRNVLPEGGFNEAPIHESGKLAHTNESES